MSDYAPKDTPQDATEEVIQLKAEIRARIIRLTELADIHKIWLDWDYEELGLGYGMGGNYESDEGWMSSSSQC